MSVIKQQKKTKQTFLGLKIGYSFSDVMFAVRVKGNQVEQHDFNVDDRTWREFIGGIGQHVKQYVANVNEDYALVVKITELSRSISVEATPHSSYAEMNLVLDIDYFVLGYDDNGKVFIHYLDSERSRRVRIHSIYDSLLLSTEEGGELDRLINNSPQLFNKYKKLGMEDILDTMNRDDLGFTRLQGDIVFKLVEGHEGYCPACIRPDDICCQAIGASKPYYVSRDGKDKKTMLYKVEPNLTTSMEICEDCIKALHRSGRIANNLSRKVTMGNHLMHSDSGNSLVEIGDSMTFSMPGVPWTRLTSDSITTEGLEREAQFITGKDYEALKNGVQWTTSFSITPEQQKEFMDSLQTITEPTHMDTAGRMWNVGQPRMIIATSQQNVILEHKEHKDKSVYIPKDNIGVFTFQRSAPVITPGLD